MVLSRGNTLDYADMYRAWAGHDPSINPYLEYYGLPVTGDGTVTPAAAPPPPPAEAPRPGERGK